MMGNSHCLNLPQLLDKLQILNGLSADVIGFYQLIVCATTIYIMK